MAIDLIPFTVTDQGLELWPVQDGSTCKPMSVLSGFKKKWSGSFIPWPQAYWTVTRCCELDCSLVQDAVARVVSQDNFLGHIASYLPHFHWLSISFQVESPAPVTTTRDFARYLLF